MPFFNTKSVLNLFSADVVSQSVNRYSGGTNVYNLGGYRGSLSNSGDQLEAVSYNCDFYGELLSAIERLKDYRRHDLSETILELFSDSVLSNIDFTTKNLVRINGDEALTKVLNDDLVHIDIRQIIRSTIKDMIYYSSYAMDPVLIDNEIEIRELKYPFTTVWSKDDRKYILQTDDGFEYSSTLLRFSTDDLNLEIDDNIISDLGDVKVVSKKYSQNRVRAGKPLFLSVELKVKDYVLKDLILSFLSLMKLLEQKTYSIDSQRMSDMDSVVELCERIKNLLVVKEDYDLLTAAKLDRTAIIRRLFDDTRVIPSIANNLQSLQQVLDSKTQEKIDSLTPQAERVRDDILTAIGFPLDLYSGRTNKWEVGRQDDRFNIKIVALKNAIVSSVVDIVYNIAKLRNKDIKRTDIEVLFIRETPSELANITNKIQAQGEASNALQSVLSTLNSIINEDKLLDRVALQEYSKKVIGGVDSSLADHIKKIEENPENGGLED